MEKFLEMSNGGEKIIESGKRLLDSERRLGSREWVDEFADRSCLDF